MQTKILIVGLGNPGPKYQFNRHNAGFILLDKYVSDLGINFNESKSYYFTNTTKDNISFYFVKPMEYMNLSGGAVINILKKYSIPIENTIVLHDELDFEFNKVKLKFSGGHAGHNGLKDIIMKSGSKDFFRIRLGIGRPVNKSEVSDYVLTNFAKEELALMDIVYKSVKECIQNAITQIETGKRNI